MSFDIFFTAFRGGEFAPFPLAVLDQAFGKFTTSKADHWWDMAYSDGSGGTIYLHPDNDGRIADFMVNRPPISPLFWDALLKLLQEMPSVVYWPGEKNCIVAGSEAAIAELPADMIAALGRPKVVTEGIEILDLIEKS